MNSPVDIRTVLFTTAHDLGWQASREEDAEHKAWLLNKKSDAECAYAAAKELIEAAGQGVMKSDGRLYFDSGDSATRFRAALARCKGEGA